jgi:excisionase family DNA binding protein
VAPLSLNPRKAKIHRSYSVAEVAALLGVTRGAVRAWCKADLPAVKIAGGLLIYGEELRAFLEKRRAARRAACPPGSIYCMKCRAPRRPLPEAITVTPLMGTGGNIRAPCPQCRATMNRRVSLPRLAESGFLGVGFRPAESHLDHSSDPSVKPHFDGKE